MHASIKIIIFNMNGPSSIGEPRSFNAFTLSLISVGEAATIASMLECPWVARQAAADGHEKAPDRQWPLVLVPRHCSGATPVTPAAKRNAGFRRAVRDAQAMFYLMAAVTFENVVFRLVPIPCTAASITIETNPAIRAYSIAVAPASSLNGRKAA